jgi:hypothetical protein
VLASFLIVLFLAVPAYGQLSEEDIEAMQEDARAEGWTFTVGENYATQYPLGNITGMKMPENWRDMAKFDPCTPTRDLPESFDWREITGCPPIRNQGPCGSCWAFATTGAFECNIRIKDGEDVDLSEQWLVSCNESGWGCDGGYFAHDYHLWKGDWCDDSGAVLEEHFPYTASDQYCECPYPHTYYLENWAYIGEAYSIPTNEQMKQAIMDHGPIGVALYVGSNFQAYNGGVFNACGSGSINHAVVLVGWDDNQGLDGVWYLRNSWGPNWGEDGYMRIKYDCAEFGTGACYVNYRRAEKIAIVADEIWDDAGGDGDSIPEAGETVQMVLSFENRYADEATDVTANLFFDDALLNVTQGTAFLGNILPEETVDNSGAPFEFEVPADYIPRTDSLFIEYIWDGGAHVDTQVVERVIGGVPILVVDDDNDAELEQYYLNDLNEMRVPYDITPGPSSIGVEMPDLNDYPIVFWFTGDYRTDPMNLISLDVISTYLDGDGSLFITGQYIAGQLSTYNPNFLNNYLKADYVSTSFIPLLDYESGGQVFLPDDEIIIMGNSGADNQTAPDQILPINGGIAELGYLNNPNMGAISFTGDYKLLYFSFGFEAIGNHDSRWTLRDTVFARIIDFFNVQTPGERPSVQSLSVFPGDPTHMTNHTPTFSWNFSDPAAQPQQMCQVQVSDDKFWLMTPVWDSGPVAASESEAVYNGSDLVDGFEYYIRIRASNGSLWSDWYYGEMRMNSIPVPTGLSPDNMESVNGDHPQLTHDTPEDAEGDSLTCAYELYDDSLMSTLLTQQDGGGSDKDGIMAWEVPMVLTADEDYYWRVRASDAFEDGEWSELASFWVMSYVYGDANGDQTVNIGDAVFIINYVFKGGPAPEPVAAGDANCDDDCNIGDAVFLINFVFKGGPEPSCE